MTDSKACTVLLNTYFRATFLNHTVSKNVSIYISKDLNENCSPWTSKYIIINNECKFSAPTVTSFLINSMNYIVRSFISIFSISSKYLALTSKLLKHTDFYFAQRLQTTLTGICYKTFP